MRRQVIIYIYSCLCFVGFSLLFQLGTFIAKSAVHNQDGARRAVM